MIDVDTMRRLLLHEARVHAIPGRDLRDLGDAILLHDAVEPEPFWNRLEGIRWPDDPGAFDRRLTEMLVLFASLGRRPHVWASPLHDAPADLVARLEANGFADLGASHVMLLTDPSASTDPSGTSLPGRRDDRAARARSIRPRSTPRRRPSSPSCSTHSRSDRIGGRRSKPRRRSSLGHPWFTHYLVRVDGVPASVARRATFDDASYLSSIGTVGWARGRGLGGLVTRTAVADAIAAGSRWTYLGVFADNPTAIGVYERAGFEQLGDPAPGPAARRMRDRADDRIRAFAAEAVSAARLPAGATGLRAVGWATVDTDRAVAQLATLLWDRRGRLRHGRGLGGPRRTVPDRRSDGGPTAGDMTLAVIEPATEGRLAAALARWDEGPVAAWYATASTGRCRRRRSAGTIRAGMDRRRRPAHRPAQAPGGVPGGYHRDMTDQATIHLRLAEASDAESIAALFTDEGYPAGPSDIVGRLERFATDDAQVIVAEHDGALLGFIAVCVAAAVRAWRLVRPDRRARRRCRRPRARRRADAHGRGRAHRARARRRVHRADRRTPPPGGAAPLRVARLRLDRDGVPSEEALTNDPGSGFPSLRLRGSSATLLDLPWDLPLAEWPETLTFRTLPIGPSRHLVRFLVVDGRLVALKEEPIRVATSEFEVLRRLEAAALPAVSPIGVSSWPGHDAAILATEYLAYSIQYRRLLMRFPLGPGPYRERLLDAMASLLVDLHRAGVFWGDCSLANTLFRRDGDKIQAYLVDAETSEIHPSLSDGQRGWDLDILVENVGFGLADLGAMQGREDAFEDAVEAAESVRQRYTALWAELNDVPELPPWDRQAIRGRIRRLNDLGFAVDEISLEPTASGEAVHLRVAVANRRFHSRELERLTGWSRSRARRASCSTTCANTEPGWRSSAAGQLDPA